MQGHFSWIQHENAYRPRPFCFGSGGRGIAPVQILIYEFFLFAFPGMKMLEIASFAFFSQEIL